MWTSDAWWSEVTLDGWESSEVFPSDSWWSGVRSEEVAIEGWQQWQIGESDEKMLIHEEGETHTTMIVKEEHKAQKKYGLIQMMNMFIKVHKQSTVMKTNLQRPRRRKRVGEN